MGYLPGQQLARWPWSGGGRCVQSSCPTSRGNRSTSRAHNPENKKKFHFMYKMCPIFLYIKRCTSFSIAYY